MSKNGTNSLDGHEAATRNEVIYTSVQVGAGQPPTRNMGEAGSVQVVMARFLHGSVCDIVGEAGSCMAN